VKLKQFTNTPKFAIHADTVYKWLYVCPHDAPRPDIKQNADGSDREREVDRRHGAARVWHLVQTHVRPVAYVQEVCTHDFWNWTGGNHKINLLQEFNN